MKTFHVVNYLVLLSFVSCAGIRPVTSPPTTHPVSGQTPTTASKKASRSIASALPLQTEVGVTLSKSTVTKCGLSFDVIEGSSTSDDFKVKDSLITNNKLPFAFALPTKLKKVTSSAASFAGAPAIAQVTITNPILPSFPIAGEDKQALLCAKLINYHTNFKNQYFGVGRNVSSSLVTFSGKVAGATISLNNNLDALVVNAIDEQENQTQGFQINLQAMNAIRNAQFDFIMFYDDLYEDDVQDLKVLHQSYGLKVKLIKLSELPGLDASGSVPVECLGTRFKECYHTWGDPIEGVSQRVVPSLKGFYRQTKAYQQYTKVSYIPGLIRAEIRRLKKLNPLKGVLLIGNSDKIAPFYTNVNGALQSAATSFYPGTKLHTDYFYMVPEAPVSVSAKLSWHKLSPWILTCSDILGNTALRFWCEDDESRFYSDPPLASTRDASYHPVGRIFLPTQTTSASNTYVNNVFNQTATLDSVVPVGRLVTKEGPSGEKDPLVADYKEKMERWHAELPSLKYNSVNSNGGTTSDTWIFTSADLAQFKTTYGQGKVYSSENFLTLSKCQGVCEFKPGEQVFDELSTMNRTAFLINGHGAHRSTQAPYYSGDVGTFYYTEYMYHIGNDSLNRRFLISHPEYNTLAKFQNKGLIGHVIANSCDVSNFNFSRDLESHVMHVEYDSEANQRSFAEQWIQVPNGGALNTYMNSDVGWSNSDNAFNDLFMEKITIAQENCGTIGDALKMTIFDLMKNLGGAAYQWQMLNRQFFGSPINMIAKKDPLCSSREEIDGGVISSDPEVIKNPTLNNTGSNPVIQNQTQLNPEG